MSNKDNSEPPGAEADSSSSSSNNNNNSFQVVFQNGKIGFGADVIGGEEEDRHENEIDLGKATGGAAAKGSLTCLTEKEEYRLSNKRLSRRPDHAYKALFQQNPARVNSMVPEQKLVKGVLYLHGAREKQAPGTVRFVCISDTHGRHRKICKIPPGDVLLHAGDFTNTGELDQIQDFSKWLSELECFKSKVVIAGNHDITLDKEYYANEYNRDRFHRANAWGGGHYNADECRAAIKNCIYLEDSLAVVEGYTIYGSPWQPEFCDWAFNLPRGVPCRKVWRKIPQKGSGVIIDILMTHGPPIGFGDRCHSGNRAGCVDLLHTVQKELEQPPQFHIFGHIHEGHGAFSDGKTTYINASTATLRYRMKNCPIVFDLPVRKIEKQGMKSAQLGGITASSFSKPGAQDSTTTNNDTGTETHDSMATKLPQPQQHDVSSRK